MVFVIGEIELHIQMQMKTILYIWSVATRVEVGAC